MIVYNTTFHIDQPAVTECLDFLKKIYIPRAIASGFLQKACLRRVLHTNPEEEGANYSVQFHVKNIDTLNYWMEQEGRELQSQLVKRFGSSVNGFSTLLEEINWEK